MCKRIFYHLIITSDKEVVLCCQDKIPEFIISKDNLNNINKIWFSKKFNYFRAQVLKNNLYLCKNCGI